MGTAKSFGFSLMKAGREAKFSKFDLQDAYKLMPAKKRGLPAARFLLPGKMVCGNPARVWWRSFTS